MQSKKVAHKQIKGEKMKVFYILFVVITDAEGFQTMERANDLQYNTKIECIVENHITKK